MQNLGLRRVLFGKFMLFGPPFVLPLIWYGQKNNRKTVMLLFPLSCDCINAGAQLYGLRRSVDYEEEIYLRRDLCLRLEEDFFLWLFFLVPC